MNEIAKEMQTVESPMISAIERAAADPKVDVDKMERLLAMQERMLGKQAEQAWAASMVLAQQEMPAIPATSENKQTHSMYAKYEVMNKLAKPVYTQHGFAPSFGQEKSEFDGCIKVICDVRHLGGHSVRYGYDTPIDDVGMQGNVNKTPTHGRASAVSYGKRYLLGLIFNLTIEGDDDDGNGGDTRSAAEINQWWIDHNIAVRDLFESIYAIKQAIATKEWHFLAEIVFELSNEEKAVIWRPAATKGGVMTTDEQKALKSNDLHAASTYLREEKGIEASPCFKK